MGVCYLMTIDEDIPELCACIELRIADGFQFIFIFIQQIPPYINDVVWMFDNLSAFELGEVIDFELGGNISGF